MIIFNSIALSMTTWTFGTPRANPHALIDPQIELIQQASDFHTNETTWHGMMTIMSIMMMVLYKLRIPRHIYLPA